MNGAVRVKVVIDFLARYGSASREKVSIAEVARVFSAGGEFARERA